MSEKNLKMIKGDTLAFGLEIEGLDQDLDTAYFTCKQDKNSDTPIFQKSLNDGISKVETGQYRVRIAPADTRNLEEGNYYYDLQIGVNSDIFTIMIGVLKITQDITTN